jgi:imidazolonepropionase-like amidohydrolase
MANETRRNFVVRGIAAGAAIRALCGQTPQLMPIPGLESGEPTRSLALRNVSVIDATGQPAMPGMTVVITGNKIQSIGRTAAPSGVPTIDGSGKCLIPGLWDMHIHDTEGKINPLFIPNGVLGVRTMGGTRFVAREFLKRRAEVAEGKVLGPRLVVASQTLYGSLARNPEEGRTAVSDAINEGADFIKVYDGLSPESYFAIADEAKKLKVPFVGHAPTPPGLEACANAGQKSFEHMAGVKRYLLQVTGLAASAINDLGIALRLSTPQAAALFDIFLRNQAWLCPTLTPVFGATGELSRDPRLKYFDDSTRAGWALWLKTPDFIARKAAGTERQQYQSNLALVGAMHKGGVGILAGTDTELVPASTGSLPYCLPGFGLHDELRHLVAAGLSPLDALRTATYNPAKFLGLLDSLGTVETGKLAELVLLDANPLDNIANTTKINMVFTGGRVYRRPALDAMLDAVETNVKNAFRLSQDVLTKYVGSYEFNAKELGIPGPEKQLVKVALDDVLWLGIGDNPKQPLTPIFETTFTGFGDRVEFAKNDKGEVSHLLIRSNGRNLRADKKN